MAKLPIRKIPGVGKINEQILAGMGIKVCPDIIDKAPMIYVNFTNNAYDFLIRACMGISKNVHEETSIKKSINCSCTFPQLITTKAEFETHIRKLCKELEQRTVEQGFSGRTVSVEFKNEDFKNKQKSLTSGFYMKKQDQFLEIALKLLNETWPVEPCRKLSVNLTSLKDDQGRVAESAHFTMLTKTGGCSRLGGSAKQRDL